jgi:threonine/homoserine/homoserine lactone efflux protein
MPFDLWLALAAYVVVTTITPGPNNGMLLATGVNHGLGGAWPHLLGVNIGFAVLMLGVGLGLGALLTQAPALHAALKIVGAAYLLWLAYGIARCGPPGGHGGSPARIGFMQAAIFQWLNPKAWIMSLGAISTYLPAESFWSGLAIAILTFSLLGLPCNITWVIAGAKLRTFLSDAKALRLFNLAMAAALAASVVTVLM